MFKGNFRDAEGVVKYDDRLYIESEEGKGRFSIGKKFFIKSILDIAYCNTE
jgi:hypothetical protein